MKKRDVVCEPATVALSEQPVVAASENNPPSLATVASRSSDTSRFMPVLTLVLWLGCSLVGVLGFAMPCGRPDAGTPEPEPLKVEMLNVELSNDPLPDVEPPDSAAVYHGVPPPFSQKQSWPQS